MATDINLIYAHSSKVNFVRGKGISYLTAQEPHICKKYTEDTSVIRRVLAFTEPTGQLNKNESYTDMRMILNGEIVMSPMIDIDNEDNLQKSYDDTNRISEALSKHGFRYGVHYLIDFSGNKGFHIKFAHQQSMEVYEKREVARRLTDLLMTIGIADIKIDESIYSDGRLMRFAGSMNAKSNRYCYTLPAINEDGTIGWSLDKILDVSTNVSVLEAYVSAPALESHVLTNNIWCKQSKTGKKPTVVPATKPKSPKAMTSCSLVNCMLSNPERLRERWANGQGKYFSDLMQVLSMYNDTAVITAIQNRIATILDGVRTDTSPKESAEYYATKEANCQSLRRLCNEMGISCETCKSCNNNVPDIPGLVVKTDKDGRPSVAKDFTNISRIIRHMCPGLKYNDVKMRAELDGKSLTNGDRLEIRSRLTREYDITVTKDTANDAIDLVMYENTYNPITDLIDSQTWDGKKRLERILIDLCGCADDIYTKELSKYIGVALITRAYYPGSKCDIVPVLVNTTHGSGKSTFCEFLGLQWLDNDKDEGYYLCMPSKISEKNEQKTSEKIGTSWVCEFNELTALEKSETEEELKAFITNRVDKYRPVYERSVLERGRRCIFFGTTNKEVFLRDPTGARRWWAVKTADDMPLKHMSGDEIKNYILQFYAEALQAVKNGAKPVITNADALAMHKKTAEDAYDVDEWEGVILNWIATNDIKFCCLLEIWEGIRAELGHKFDSLDSVSYAKTRIKKIFQRLGWASKSMWTRNYKQQRCYIKQTLGESTDNIVKIHGTADTVVKTSGVFDEQEAVIE